jgi:ankyrin repeat protein
LYRCVDLEPELQNDDLFNLGVIKSKVLEKTKDKKLLNGKVLPMTRLTSACADNNSSRVKFLLSRGAKACPSEGYSPLILCCEYGCLEALTALLNHVEKKPFRLAHMRFGQSLEKAALASYEERRASADINVRDSFGRSAIHIAALGGHHRLISVLVNFGADVNAQMPQGRTALMIASGYDHTRTIVELLKNGADVRITDNDSWTCLDYNRTVAVGTSYFAAVQKEEVRQLLIEFSKNESERRPISTILKGYF